MDCRSTETVLNCFEDKIFTLNFRLLYCREARQIPETMKQDALQLELVLGSYGARKFSHTFPTEKLPS